MSDEEKAYSGLANYIETRRKLIDLELDKIIKTYEGEVLEISKYIISGGKRFRGILTLLICEALGGSIRDSMDAAVAVELMHSASLAIDDIIDGDLYRRGKISSWVRHGISKTILVANLLIPKAQIMIEKYGLDALVHVIRTWLDSTTGEILDVFGAPRDLSNYEVVALLKTASIFRVSAYLGAVSANASKEIKYNASKYGESLGVLYQVVDDLVDLLKMLDSSDGNIDIEKNIGEVASLKMFLEWLNIEEPSNTDELIEKATAKISDFLRELSGYIGGFPESRYKLYIAFLPNIMIRYMLGELGSWGEDIYRMIPAKS